jgi:hypothetical protein
MTGAARPHMWYYYSGDNFGRKEPQLVSFYERDEKEPVVWEHRRGDYVITLWRTVDVGSFYERDEVTSWDKLRVRYQGKTVCKVQGGNWVDTARCCPSKNRTNRPKVSRKCTGIWDICDWQDQSYGSHGCVCWKSASPHHRSLQ